MARYLTEKDVMAVDPPIEYFKVPPVFDLLFELVISTIKVLV